MSRDVFALEKSLRIFKENSDSVFFDMLFGTGAPGGDTGEQDAASIGSLYSRYDVPGLYQKKLNNGNAGDWELNGAGTISVVPVFRNINVKAATADALGVGVRNLTTTPLSDDDAPLMVATDFTVGDYLIGGVGSTPVLYKVTAVASPNITLSVTGFTALTSNDGFVVSNYLPNAPGSMENMALVIYQGSAIIKIADVNWNFATGISLSSGYSSAAGSVAASDTVEKAISNLDQRTKDLNTLSGVAANATILGAFSGALASVIGASSTIKAAFQSLLTYLETVGQTSVNALTALADVDTVKVDDVASVKWYVRAWEDANPARVKAFEIHATHNGTAVADATLSDDSVYSLLKIGAAFNLSLSVDLNGTGASQVMRLRAATATAGVSLRIYKEVVKF